MRNIEEKKKLGKTNLLVTPLCWGGAPLGNMPKDFGYEVPEEQATQILFEILKSPVNFLDTASIYGDSERRIGNAISKVGLPEGFIVATKADRSLKDNSFTAKQIRKSVENSLKLLGIKPLPLVYLHDPEHSSSSFEEIIAPDGAVAELEKLREEGAILNIGISGGPIDVLLNYIKTGRFEAVITHNRWNLLWQTADPLIELANEMGIAVVNAAPFASGMLATGANSKGRVAYRLPSQEIIGRVVKIESVCRKYSVPLAAAALQFSLRDQRIASTIVGVASPEQIAENLRLAQLTVPEALWQEIRLFAITEGDPEQN